MVETLKLKAIVSPRLNFARRLTIDGPSDTLWKTDDETKKQKSKKKKKKEIKDKVKN